MYLLLCSCVVVAAARAAAILVCASVYLRRRRWRAAPSGWRWLAAALRRCGAPTMMAAAAAGRPASGRRSAEAQVKANPANAARAVKVSIHDDDDAEQSIAPVHWFHSQFQFRRTRRCCLAPSSVGRRGFTGISLVDDDDDDGDGDGDDYDAVAR